MLKWKALAVVGVSFGLAGVSWGFAQQPRPPGFFELRIYTTLPGQRAALAARFGDHTTKIYERHGIRNVGYWLAASGENADRTFVYMRGVPVAAGPRRAPRRRPRRSGVPRGGDDGGAKPRHQTHRVGAVSGSDPDRLLGH